MFEGEISTALLHYLQGTRKEIVIVNKCYVVAIYIILVANKKRKVEIVARLAGFFKARLHWRFLLQF